MSTTRGVPAAVAALSVVVLALLGCSDDDQPRRSFEMCGKTMTVVDGATAYNWGDRYGDTDGHTVWDVVPTGSIDAPTSIDQIVDGLDEFVVVDTSDGRTASYRLTAGGTGCFALVSFVQGEDVDLFYPSSGYPWVISFSE